MTTICHWMIRPMKIFCVRHWRAVSRLQNEASFLCWSRRCHSPNFAMKAWIASYSLMGLLFFPCKSRFQLPRVSKMFTRFTNASWNLSDMNDKRSCFTRVTRDSFSSFLTSYTRASTLPYDNHQTDVWNSRVPWLESMSSHSLGNNLVWTALGLTKLMVWLIVASLSHTATAKSPGGQSLSVDHAVRSNGIGSPLYPDKKSTSRFKHCYNTICADPQKFFPFLTFLLENLAKTWPHTVLSRSNDLTKWPSIYFSMEEDPTKRT